MLKPLNSLTILDNQIYSAYVPNVDQQDELKVRAHVASKDYSDYYKAISKSHSISVMDLEVKAFLNTVEKDGIILDIGGCWGWHWRFIAEERPDVKVVIVDFLKENFIHTHRILGTLIGNQVFLVHADATSLPFPDHSFSAVWTVQVFQHIPNFQKACQEAHRVLKANGIFKNYSLNITPVVRIIYSLFGKKYHIAGIPAGNFFLNRASDEQKQIIIDLFGKTKFRESYSESFFHPDLKITFSGRKGNFFGYLDYYFSKIGILSKFIARQKSFEAVRK
ncbi:class I SAM-dependent methyltransferase [Leptospira kanakyensis]|uniref:class I SAM-dependent methyltransferase n=1 Tax=Leptospira kanakyensis TaxID=2484968 RepID=UPI00223D4B87|nr:class I SAM-dependent methyltransferase [Leptospira kanakyensis]MCW7482117.1 class I SAM-dependent methyltransferase [Leptospira kanakyensis]